MIAPATRYPSTGLRCNFLKETTINTALEISINIEGRRPRLFITMVACRKFFDLRSTVMITCT